jgi:dihydrolipoamide dehydrogenase
MTELQAFDVIFIGGGPAGYTGAIRAAQLGQKVACVELDPRLGGTCLRVGCIPSKALLESSDKFLETKNTLKKHGILIDNVKLDLATMQKRKETIVTQLTGGIAGLFKKNKVTRFLGQGRLDGPGKVIVKAADGVETAITGKHVIVATGSVVTPLKGVELDGNRIGTSTEALAWAEVPEHLVVIGGGVIGLELGSVWLRLGAKVTVLEYLDRIMAGTDLEVANAAQKLFKRQGMDFKLGVRVTGAKVVGEKVEVTIADAEPITCSHVLLAVGRKPNTEGLALETCGITLEPRGQIAVDAHFCTNAAGVYAVGDVIHGPMLAHKAEEDAVACVEQIVNGYGHVDYNLVPGVVYTEPEIATVGKSEEELKAANIAYRKGSFPFAANGRAIALGHTDGFVKLLADASTDRVLGCAIIGPRAGDLIAEVAAAMAFGASSEDIARTCHAHPTLAEVVKEAALAVDGRAVNI